MNDSPEFLTPSLKLCSGVTLCMLFITLLTCCERNHGSCVHYYSPALRSDIFYRGLNAIAIPAMEHRTVNWNLFARLSTMTITTVPFQHNIRMFSGILALSLKNDADTGESFPPRGSHCRLRRKCSESNSPRGVIHASDTVLLTTVAV